MKREVWGRAGGLSDASPRAGMQGQSAGRGIAGAIPSSDENFVPWGERLGENTHKPGEMEYLSVLGGRNVFTWQYVWGVCVLIWLDEQLGLAALITSSAEISSTSLCPVATLLLVQSKPHLFTPNPFPSFFKKKKKKGSATVTLFPHILYLNTLLSMFQYALKRNNFAEGKKTKVQTMTKTEMDVGTWGDSCTSNCFLLSFIKLR